MLKFGIFRKIKFVEEEKRELTEIALEWDEDEVCGKIMERIQSNLPLLPEKKRFYHANPRGWTRAEVSMAFLAAWNDVVKAIKNETIRVL